MFSRGKSRKSAETAAPPAKPAAPSLLSTDMRVLGDIVSEGEVQIDGTINGDIRSRILLVGQSAHITGEITADSVTVHGRVTGQIKARAVILATTAHVVGDVLHEDLSIEKGAFLEGHCKRMEPEVEEPKEPETIPMPADGKVNLVSRTGAASAATPTPAQTTVDDSGEDDSDGEGKKAVG